MIINANDWPDFRKAVDTVGNKGCTVYFPSRDEPYNINNWDVPANVQLLGDGQKSVLLANAVPMRVSSYYGGRVENLRIDGAGCKVDGARNWVFSNVTFGNDIGAPVLILDGPAYFNSFHIFLDYVEHGIEVRDRCNDNFILPGSQLRCSVSTVNFRHFAHKWNFTGVAFEGPDPVNNQVAGRIDIRGEDHSFNSCRFESHINEPPAEVCLHDDTKRVSGLTNRVSNFTLIDNGQDNTLAGSAVGWRT
jgi:hypothetical protein